MDATQQITKFQEFFEDNYHAEILELLRKGKNFIFVDFVKLLNFDPDLSSIILDYPEELIKAAEIAIEKFDMPSKMKKFRVRFVNIPESQKIMIKNIRSKHLEKMVVVEGIVRQKSDVRPKVATARFECPSCGNVINVIQLDKAFKEPNRCGCGRKGKFRLLSKEFIDAQGIVLEEATEDLEGGEQPKRINIFLSEDLVSPLSERKTNPGSKIRIAGILKEVPMELRSGATSTKFDFIIEANSVEGIQEDYYDINISPEEEEKILELSKDPKCLQKIVNSVAPSIYGYEQIKEALILQLVGGFKKTRADGTTTRGDMHVLLIGDPGAAKSQLLKRISLVAPKARYVSGKGVSGAGLTATVVKDEFMGGWALEAGALVLANKGFCMIDEMDKMTPEDRSAMHEALEQQTVSISKANIQATLRCETTVLAAANPKYGRFDPYGNIAEQINLPPALVNRFDLIFAIKDLPNIEKDTKIASHILDLHRNPNFITPEIDTELLKKFISYVRQKLKPQLTSAAMEELIKYYIEMRNSGGEEGGVKSVPISARQLEALVRLSEASAKVRFSKKISRKDAKKAISLLHYSLLQIGVDPETGKIDIDRIATGIPSSERSKMIQIKEIISTIEDKIGKTIPIDDVVTEAEIKGISEDVVEEVIEKLKRDGDLFEPKRGFIQKI